MNRYPRSFIQLVTLGYTLVVIPFLLVTIYAFITLETLYGHYHVAVEDFSETSRLTVEIAEDLVNMERNLRRYEVLKDSDSLNDYAQARVQWQDNVKAFSNLPAMPERVVSELHAQIRLENQAYAAFRESQRTNSLRLTIDEIKSRVKNLQDAVRDFLEQEQAQFMTEADVLRHRLLFTMGVAVLVAFCFIWMGRRLLSRLIGRFERAVLRLGKGDLQQAIDLHGPSDMRWLGRWLEWLRRRLLSLEEARTRVLRHVSHELKTPLAAMREGINLLAEEVPDSLTVEQARIVNILQGNYQRLDNLIEGLLRLQQAGHAAERIEFEPLRFDLLIGQVLETYRLIAAERHVKFQAALPEITIIAGREGLLTIVNNLLSNAVKYSPENGQVSIALSTHRDQVFLDVSDEGPGITTAERTKIFEPFYRSSTSRLISGVGLGLTIAREFVLAHHGKLLLLDSSQDGAHFRAILPMNAPFVRTQQNA